MVENRTMDSIHRGLLKKFHTLCSKLGLDAEAKRSIVESYGVESSKDIDTHDLVDLCARLSSQLHVDDSEMSKMRKRAMAAIGGWLNTMELDSNSAFIKSIACRATGHKEFNRIPKERLRNVIYTFNNKSKDANSINELVAHILATGKN